MIVEYQLRMPIGDSQHFTRHQVSTDSTDTEHVDPLYYSMPAINACEKTSGSAEVGVTKFLLAGCWLMLYVTRNKFLGAREKALKKNIESHNLSELAASGGDEMGWWWHTADRAVRQPSLYFP